MINRKLAEKVLQTVDAGLCSGVGKPIPGQMCVEAAVCFAMGLPHGDTPSCVGSAVRAFKIRLNDAHWSSNEARAAGMRALAIAQLGSDQIDQRKFADLVVLKTIRQILPIVLRSAAEKATSSHQEKLLSSARKCEAASDLIQAKLAAQEARNTTYYAADATYYATAAGASAAAAIAAADAAADAADAAAYYAAAAAADAAFLLSAKIGLEALKECSSPGCSFLDLCE